MPEIYNFRIDKAEAFVDTVNGKKRLTVHLTYPDNPEVIERRFPENLQRGIEVFWNLTNNGYSTIGPTKPASSGSLYVFKDGKILVHRRDHKAPTHKMMHSAYAGFAANREHVYTRKGVTDNALRETSEEVLLTRGLVPFSDEVLFMTPDKKPWLFVPEDSRDHSIESAKRLGIDHLKVQEMPVEIMQPTDTLVVTDEKGELIYRANAFIDLLYESQTSLNALQIRILPFDSTELYPIDAEGFVKGNDFIHLNRESYIIDPKEIAGKGFGHILRDPLVFKTEFIDGPDGRIPVSRLQTKDNYKLPYLGPDFGPTGVVEVIDPHIFAPEDLLRRALDALGVEGYANRWMDIELQINSMKQAGASLLPERVKVKTDNNVAVEIKK